MLAGHQCMVAQLVAGSEGAVAGGENVWRTDDPQIGVDMQAAQRIALGRHLGRQLTGPDACCPDHGGSVDALAVREGDAVLVHRDNRTGQAPFDPQFGGCLGDHRGDGGAH